VTRQLQHVPQEMLWADRAAHASFAIVRITEPETLQGIFLVAFRPAMAPAEDRKSTASPPTKRAARQLEKLEHELRYTKESLQTTRIC
jgi:hypothetical protein